MRRVFKLGGGFVTLITPDEILWLASAYWFLLGMSVGAAIVGVRNP